MRLLFDENLSPKLVDLLEDDFPDSAHVYDLGLGGASDSQIWDQARADGFVIVSKDDDFRQRSFVEGAPPKVVWLQVGNAGTRPIAPARVDEPRSFGCSNDEASLATRTRQLAAIKWLAALRGGREGPGR